MRPLHSSHNDLVASSPLAVRDYIRQLEAFNGELLAQIATLITGWYGFESWLQQNSSSSSRPPLTDGPRHQSDVPSLPSQRRRGGQKRHPKAERTILPPDEIIDHTPSQCSDCGATPYGDDTNPLIDQVIELPKKLFQVTQYRRHPLDCPHYWARTTDSSAPEAAQEGGLRLQAVFSYFSGFGGLGKRSIARICGDLFGIPMATGSISKLEARTSSALQSIHAEALDHTQGQNANVDETGWKEGPNKAWLWVAVTNPVTVFLIRRRRDRGAFDDLVGPNPGVLTTDRYSVYGHLKPNDRQVCWAHLRRDVQAMVDRHNEGMKLGEDLLHYADILADQWKNVRDGTRSRRWCRCQIFPWLRDEIHGLLKAGSQCVCVKTAGVCRELLGIESSLWTFTSKPNVEPTNSAAERAVRHAGCWRKTSYGTNSERGSRFV